MTNQGHQGLKAKVKAKAIKAWSRVRRCFPITENSPTEENTLNANLLVHADGATQCEDFLRENELVTTNIFAPSNETSAFTPPELLHYSDRIDEEAEEVVELMVVPPEQKKENPKPPPIIIPTAPPGAYPQAFYLVIND